MAEPGEYSTSRLLRKRRGRDPTGDRPEPPPDDPGSDGFDSPDSHTICINCSYDLRGQAVNRCPECGLFLASLT